jgi:DNA-binding transcriptional LysR family regulator
LGPWPDLEYTLLFREALVLAGLPALVRKRRRDGLASLVRSVPIIQARTRPHDLSQWWQGAGLGGRAPRPSLIVENRAQAVAAAQTGLGVTLIHPFFIEAPSPMSALATVSEKTVPLREGYFLVMPERSRSRRNINLLAGWLASEAAKARGNSGVTGRP